MPRCGVDEMLPLPANDCVVVTCFKGRAYHSTPKTGQRTMTGRANSEPVSAMRKIRRVGRVPILSAPGPHKIAKSHGVHRQLCCVHSFVLSLNTQSLNDKFRHFAARILLLPGDETPVAHSKRPPQTTLHVVGAMFPGGVFNAPGKNL